jgi:pimeloyl-ACP methyl ester carboxylesterase
MSKLRKIIQRSLMWTAAITLSLALLVVAYSYYIVISFDTKTLPQGYGNVDAKLFQPDAQNSAPSSIQSEAPQRALLVGLGGSEGGNGWTATRWEAQRQRFHEMGFAVLALGYFGLPNTPKKLDRIALEGIVSAIKKAQAEPGISDRCVVLIGGSKGAELALLLASRYPEIDAVIAMVPGSVAFPAHTDAMVTSSWAQHGKQVDFVPMPWSASFDLLKGDLHAVMERMLRNQAAVERASIAVERINGPILFVSASQDEMWPSQRMSQQMMERLQTSKFAFPTQHLAVEGSHVGVFKDFSGVESFLAKLPQSKPLCGP